MGNTAAILDTSVSTATIGMQTAVVVYKFFSQQKIPIFEEIPPLLKIIALPCSIVFFVLGVLEGFTEFVSLKRVISFVQHIESQPEDPLSQLNYIKTHYFSLTPKYVTKIKTFIDNTLSDLPKNEKAKHFDRIAQKVLQVRFEGLKRRITPGLGEEVATQLNIIITDLQSRDKTIRNNGKIAPKFS